MLVYQRVHFLSFFAGMNIHQSQLVTLWPIPKSQEPVGMNINEHIHTSNWTHSATNISKVGIGSLEEQVWGKQFKQQALDTA